MKEKTKKPIFKKVWFCVLVVVVIGVFYSLGSGETGEQNTEQAEQVQTDGQENSTKQQEEQEPEKTDSGVVGDYDVTIGDCAFTTDIDGNNAIIVNYDFTNNSDEHIAPFVGISMTAFQDGVQLDAAFVMDTSVYDAGVGQKQLKPGASLTGCQNAYVLTSTSPVEVEVGPLFGDPVLFKTFDVH